MLAGIMVACVIMIAASALMSGWRYMYPLAPAILPTSPNQDTSMPVEGTILGSKIEGLESQLSVLSAKLESFVRSYISASDSQSKRLDLTSTQLSELSGRLSKIESTLKPQEKGLLAHTFLMNTDGTRLGGIESRIELLQADMNKAFEVVETRLEEQKHNHHLLHDRVWTTFRAKQVLENVTMLLRKLDETSGFLSIPKTTPEAAVDWDRWAQEFKAWQVSLHNLCALIKPYLDVQDALLETPADRYKSQYWSMNFDQKYFPSPDHIHDFKTFRILYRNLEDRRTKILEAIRHEAFV